MMFSAPLDLSGLGNTPGSSTAKSATSATNAEATQDRFLKLLVAQLNNQDPMNPMDNAQMTTQMTQINTVAGIESLNTTLKGMATQFTAMQNLQGLSLIGREALVEGKTFGFDGTVGKAAFRIDSPADSVQVDVLDKAGQLLTELTPRRIDELVADGTISGGMLPKIAGALDAARSGVNAVHIVDGRVAHAMLLEILTDQAYGTMIRSHGVAR